MTFMQWLALRIGTAIDVDGVDGAQCVDAINDYLLQVYGDRRVTGNAIDIATQTIAGFTWRANGADNNPRPGSIVVWRKNDAYLGLGQFGHTAISVYSDKGGLVTADQNWGGLQCLSFWTHTYRSVAGWHYPSS
jgi:hypothetical protein